MTNLAIELMVFTIVLVNFGAILIALLDKSLTDKSILIFRELLKKSAF